VINEPEPGSAEWVELRQEQTQEHGNKTTRFQPHRADGKRTAGTRRTLPGRVMVGLILWSLIYNVAHIDEPWLDLPGGYSEIGRTLTILFLCVLLAGAGQDALRWLKDKD
jgi:hypothetical protein